MPLIALASVDSSVSDLMILHHDVMRILLWVVLGYAGLYVLAFPILTLAKKKKARTIMTGYLYVLPLFLGTLYLSFMIFVAQFLIIRSASDQSLPPHKALQAGLREKIEKENLGSPGGEEDPYEILVRSSPKFSSSGYAEGARWTVRAAGRVLSVYDLLILAFLLVSLIAAVGPIAWDLLGHPIRRATEGEPLGKMLWTVFKRLLGMVLYLMFGSIVFTLFALLFAWLTYAMTQLASSLIADVSFAASGAPSLLVFLHIMGSAVFLVETTLLLALSMAAVSASAGTAIKWQLQSTLIGGAAPAGFRDAFVGFVKLVGKLVVVSAVAYLAVRLLLLVFPLIMGLPLCILLETAGLNLALFWWKAHRDGKHLVKGFWNLHTYGARQMLRRA